MEIDQWLTSKAKYLDEESDDYVQICKFCYPDSDEYKHDAKRYVKWVKEGSEEVKADLEFHATTISPNSTVMGARIAAAVNCSSRNVSTAVDCCTLQH